MAKSKPRNPPQNFIIKGGSIYLTGAKKKLSPQEELQLWATLSQRHWGKFLKNLGIAFRHTFENTRRQSVTDTQPTNQEGNTHE